MKDTYCSHCGNKFLITQYKYPKVCGECRDITYINPLPVAVLIIPIENGVLTARRGEAPGKGELGLIGGYLDAGETWQEGAAREVFEETCITIKPSDIQLYSIESSHVHNTLLIFGISPKISTEALNNFKPNPEVSELVIVSQPCDLAFSTHTKTLNSYFQNRKLGI